MMKVLRCATLVFVLFAVRAHAMEFHLVRFENENVHAIAADGYIDSGDLERLQSIIPQATRNKNGRYVILLNSLGGRAVEAFRLAKIITKEKFIAVVPPGFSCASACSSILYFAADHFYTLGTGKLGFHSCSHGRRRSDLCNQFILDHAREHGVDRYMLSKILNDVSPSKIVWFEGRDACKQGFCNLPGRLAGTGSGENQKFWSLGPLSFAVRTAHQADCQGFYEVNSNLRFGLIHSHRFGWRLIVQDERLRVNWDSRQVAKVSVNEIPIWVKVKTVRAGNITEFEINKFVVLMNSLIENSAITYHFDHLDRGTIPIPALKQGVELIRSCIGKQSS